MAAPATDTKPRWLRTFHKWETFVDDLGELGISVGPRKGPNKRTQGEKEDYVLRRYLVALRLSGRLELPVHVRATNDEPSEPDFTFEWRDGQALGLEVTEAGEEDYQRWLTQYESEFASDTAAVAAPIEVSTERTAGEIKRAIARKVEQYDKGKYRMSASCDLVVYDNTAWGGFLDKREIVAALGRPNSLLGRFRQIHIVFGGVIYLDVFGNESRAVDISGRYEIDYVRWISEQRGLLESGEADGLDLPNIAEELGDLGKSDHRAVSSHLRNMILHLLKWQYQHKKRSQSWSLSIDNARSALFELLTESPSLRVELTKKAAQAYVRARRDAAKQTGLDLADIPEACPFTLEQLLDDDYLPGGNH